MSRPEGTRSSRRSLQVKFVPDEDVLKHIADDSGTKVRKDKAQLSVSVKRFVKKLENISDHEAQENLEEKNYVAALGICAQDPVGNGSNISGGEVYSFQTPKRSNKMAELASELAQTPEKNVGPDHSKCPEKMAKTPQSKMFLLMHAFSLLFQNKKKEFVSTTPYRLRKRLAAPDPYLESESEYSASCSEEEDEEEQKECSTVLSDQKTPAKTKAASTPPPRNSLAKKIKEPKMGNLVEEYFEAHSSSKVLTSDRTLQKFRKRRLNQQTLHDLLKSTPLAYAAEIRELNQQHESLFSKWMLQL
ncbi:ORC2 protein, partial [Hippolais icterina]|nr:ORC2 protein [Hippolais icterina]